MKRKSPRTYRSRRPIKVILTILLSLIIAAIIVTVSLFFGLRQYIIYDEDGKLHLEIPWLEEESSD
jgi:uncharacterized membrane protein (UPF0136 family)